MNTSTKYSNRYIAQIDIESVTPLAIGSGEKSIHTDSLVTKDVNGLPYIPGTSVAGVIRGSLVGLDVDELFGFQSRNGGKGSKIIFSDGRLIGKRGRPIDGIVSSDVDGVESAFLERFASLPIRQHVRISAGGAAEKGGKFDEQIVFKGTRFRFEIELRSETDEKESFLKIIDAMFRTDFRLGGGTRTGFGKMKVVSCIWRSYDLLDAEDREAYLSKTSSLGDALDGCRYAPEMDCSDVMTYRLLLRPVDFFLIGSGFGDDEADMTSVSETYLTWKDGVPSFKTANVVVPASSLKGALAHRTAFHFNKNSANCFLDTTGMESLSSHVGDTNPAVSCLFGTSNGQITRGKVLLDDIIQSSDNVKPFVQSHVSIDRFTGGARNGALYQEKTLFARGEVLETEITITRFKDVEDGYITAFEDALKDLCSGLLSLGGGTNRGNGCFEGEIYRGGCRI